MLSAALLIAAFFAGVAGSWSPCGFSAVHTLGVGGHAGGRRTTLAAVATFTVGAFAGGLITFVSLSALGSLAGGLGGAVAAAIAILAAILDLRGARIVPQIRRQVPEPWRRTMPLPLAGALYGVLLGLGFTTFVLTFAVWALAGISVALGSLHAGVLIGLGFAFGRALPVAVLAPIVDLPAGERATALMAERPQLLRGVRAADGVALVGVAAALAVSSASAAQSAPVLAAGEDPSAVTDGIVAFQAPGLGGWLLQGGTLTALPCEDPSLGGGQLACISGSTVLVGPAPGGAPFPVSVAVPGVDKVAVSAGWLAYRIAADPAAGRPLQEIVARSLSPLGPPVLLGSATPPDQLGRPMISGSTVVFSANHASQQPSRIYSFNLATQKGGAIVSDATAQLLNPAVAGSKLLYVRVSDCQQQLLLAPLGAPAQTRQLAAAPTEISRDGTYTPGAIREGRTPHHCVGPLAGSYAGTTSYWTTALTAKSAYLTLVLTSGAHTTLQLIRIGL
jgi:hypothetical protein